MLLWYYLDFLIAWWQYYSHFDGFTVCWRNVAVISNYCMVSDMVLVFQLFTCWQKILQSFLINCLLVKMLQSFQLNHFLLAKKRCSHINLLHAGKNVAVISTYCMLARMLQSYQLTAYWQECCSHINLLHAGKHVAVISVYCLLVKKYQML